ncbi:MAG TPA: aminoacyl-histidine dipeptidase [Lachnospiraceae bacterium]|nr:aminoacyl-histidine dipeptidase [Lachnospiraceae bacterium]
MGSKLVGIDYKNIFKYFEEISDIPRGSGNMQAISDYLVGFAKQHGLEYIQDDVLNVIMFKEATSGYENAPAVMIQGHMDMVCEKETWIEHDFLTQGIDLIVDGDYLKANGTTLGADDGIAVAYALAILSDNTIQHPRLEVVITTNEETGMDGAIGLDTTPFKAKYMLNIDSEEEGVILCGCAGGLSGTSSLKLEYEKVADTTTFVNIDVTGLQGGHSGAEIDKNRSNANILIGRLLLQLSKDYSFSLVDIHGGNKHNAIPRDSFATIAVERKDLQVIIDRLNEIALILKSELSMSEPDALIKASHNEYPYSKVMTTEITRKIIFMLEVAPIGVQVMSSNIEGLVESSVNMGILKIENDTIEFHFSVRSSLNSYKHFVSEKLELLAQSIGAEYLMDGEYPAWEYRKDSKFRQLLIDIYKEEHGNEPTVVSIHAGLECGIISEKLNEIDIVSIGPDMADIHTPKERLKISSTKSLYDYILKVLESIKE